MIKRRRPEPDGLEVMPVRLPPETIAEIKRRAEAERRPVSQFLRNLIHDALRAKKEIR